MAAIKRPDPAWLDSEYNNRALVPAYEQHFKRWAADSEKAHRNLGGLRDLAYGHGPSEKLDIYTSPRKPGRPLAPVLVFIHGGYWRSLDKAEHAFVAPAFVKQGACVVVPNYALCPAVTIPDITLQMVNALAWVHRHIAVHGGDPQRITVVGHSAGGHLAAMLLTCRWSDYAADLPDQVVKNALAISGLFDLEPVRRAPFLQASLRLTPAQAKKASPALLPAPSGATLNSAVGGLESSEFLRQNRLIQERWGMDAVPVCEALPGLNHFSVLEALTAPRHRLHRMACDLLGL